MGIQKVNYQLVTDRILEDILKESAETGKRPSLLLHSCCGPCSSYVLEYLTDYFDISLLYFNPNIMPREEYIHRLEEQKRLCSEMKTSGRIDVIEGEYEPQRFLDAVKGYESEPEGGARCAICFRLRLEEAARICKEKGCNMFASTLSVSPHKDAALLNSIGQTLADEYKVSYLPSDFKKRGGYQRSIALSKEYGLYRQTFCGCPFAREKMSD